MQSWWCLQEKVISYSKNMIIRYFPEIDPVASLANSNVKNSHFKSLSDLIFSGILLPSLSHNSVTIALLPNLDLCKFM